MSAQNFLIHPTEAQLAAAVEENLFALFRAITTLPGSKLMENEKLCYHHAFPTNPMFKGIWRTNLNPDEADAQIDETIAWFKTHGAPYFFWWVGSGTKPVDLPERLKAHGFEPNIVGDPGMAIDLHTLGDDLQVPQNFRIALPTEQKELDDWRDVFCAAYEIPEFAGQAWVDATLKKGIDSAPWQLYVGYLDDKPVACNILFNGAGAASVYGVGTIPEARGKGIGAAITQKPLLDARAQGYHFGVLFSTEMGFPVYQRLGFRELNCKIGRYIFWNLGSS